MIGLPSQVTFISLVSSSQLLEEINVYDASRNEREGMEEYKKTSLKSCVTLFDSFLADLAKDNILHEELKIGK